MSGIYDIIRPHADAAPDRIALISDAEGVRTYGEVVAGAARFGYAAQYRLALEVGDRVCIWLSNRFDWFDAYIGASAVGVATVQARSSRSCSSTRQIPVASSSCSVAAAAACNDTKGSIMCQ